MLPIQVFLSGVTAGSIYAIVALGFVLIYKGTKIIHFGLGEQVVLGAYLVLITQLYAGVPFLFNFGVPWEHNISFSQGASIRGGRLVLLSGQASLDDQDNVVGKGDMELQVRTSLEAVRKGLALAGATPADVIKLNVYQGL